MFIVLALFVLFGWAAYCWLGIKAVSWLFAPERTLPGAASTLADGIFVGLLPMLVTLGQLSGATEYSLGLRWYSGLLIPACIFAYFYLRYSERRGPPLAHRLCTYLVAAGACFNWGIVFYEWEFIFLFGGLALLFTVTAWHWGMVRMPRAEAAVAPVVGLLLAGPAVYLAVELL